MFLVLEIYARLIHQHGIEASARYSADIRLRQICEVFQPELWQQPWKVYRPNSSAAFSIGGMTYEVHINNLGFRGREFKRVFSDDIIIACLGGSTTVGGISDDQTYPALLEQFLRMQRRNVTVLNCGISGIKTGNYSFPVSTLLKNVRPDVVVEYNAVNDLCLHLFPRWKSELSSFQHLLLNSYFIRYFCGDYFLPSENQIRQEIRQYSIRNLKTTAALLEQQGIRFCVCSFLYPDISKATKDEYFYLDNDLRYWWGTEYISYKRYCQIVDMYNEELKKTFQGSSVMYIPLAESQKMPPGEFLDICHMESSGYMKMSYKLAGFLLPVMNKISLLRSRNHD